LIYLPGCTLYLPNKTKLMNHNVILFRIIMIINKQFQGNNLKCSWQKQALTPLFFQIRLHRLALVQLSLPPLYPQNRPYLPRIRNTQLVSILMVPSK